MRNYPQSILLTPDKEWEAAQKYLHSTATREVNKPASSRLYPWLKERLKRGMAFLAERSLSEIRPGLAMTERIFIHLPL